MFNTDSGPSTPVCSSKGCQAPADWQVLWNNPKLHTPERRKVWLACEAHRTTLGDFLSARGFLKDVVPFETDAN
ncbi:acetone carboxylase [Nocardioides alcanivorans]|uniref:acetone carboxylase n=1 Tax=Nocardioides alcanivorans TaxID=2897352 RepID=UPI001F1CF472|nr:acetone carboxylase [Nocardioides alcanivorans]